MKVKVCDNAHIKVAYTSGQFFEKIMKRYPIFSLQINYYQIDERHKWNILLVNFILTAPKMELSYFLHMLQC